MKMRDVIRVAGPVIGSLGFVVAASVVGGVWGYGVGGVVFFGCAWSSDLIWRRDASRDEIRRDLEDRARNSLP
jgi:uncharacterized protein (DUF697 family)